MRYRGLYIGMNRLPPSDRYWGRQSNWYDGPIESFGFWWFHIYTMVDLT